MAAPAMASSSVETATSMASSSVKVVAEMVSTREAVMPATDEDVTAVITSIERRTVVSVVRIISRIVRLIVSRTKPARLHGAAATENADGDRPKRDRDPFCPGHLL
jgi:hypothetical protein